MTATFAGRWRCSACDRPHGLIRDADLCCAHAKGLGVEDMDSTDITEMRMQTEIQRLQTEVRHLESEKGNALVDLAAAQKRVGDCESALRACVRYFDRDPRDGQPKTWVRKMLDGVSHGGES